MTTLRERQAPLKARYEDDPESAKLVMTVRSATSGVDPTRCTIAAVGTSGSTGVTWEAGAHPMAGGEGDLACSGDLLLASLASCYALALAWAAGRKGTELPDLTVAATGTYDGQCFRSLTLTVQTSLTADRVTPLLEPAKRVCYVSNTFLNAPEITVELAEQAPAR